MPDEKEQAAPEPPELEWKLWVYTNFDCNIKCSYCVAESTPATPQNGLNLSTVKQLVDEAVALGFREIFFTGGEPFILDDIYDMLAYASARMQTTVLTNAMLLRRKRLEKLCAIANDNLIVQISLDGGRAEHHDAYRGQGTWAKTVAGIKLLQEHNFRIRLSTTETPANTAHISELHEFRRALGIFDEDHFVRPLAKRGFAQSGLEVSVSNLVPELTVTRDGVYWHPLISPNATDMHVRAQIFPLVSAVQSIQQQLEHMARTGDTALQTFT